MTSTNVIKYFEVINDLKIIIKELNLIKLYCIDIKPKFLKEESN